MRWSGQSRVEAAAFEDCGNKAIKEPSHSARCTPFHCFILRQDGKPEVDIEEEEEEEERRRDKGREMEQNMKEEEESGSEKKGSSNRIQESAAFQRGQH